MVTRNAAAQARNFTTRFTATPSPLNWTRRKRSAAEVAAGDGAASAEVAQRLKAIALASEAEPSLDGVHATPPSTDPTEAAAGSSISSDPEKAAGSRGRHLTELPIGAFQKLPQVRRVGC